MADPASELDLLPKVSATGPAPQAPGGRGPLVDSPLIEQTDAARRPMPGLWAAAIGLTPFATVLAGVAAVQALKPQSEVEATVIVSIVALGPLLVAAWLLMSVVEGRPARTRRPGLVASVAFGMLLALAGLGLATAIPALAGGAMLKPVQAAPLALATAFGLIGLQAAGEEVFFRGWLLPILTSRWGAWVGLIASGVLFAAPHFIGSPLTPLAVVNDTLAGVVFGMLALRTGGLAAPIAAHFAWNFTEAHVIGVFPNPGVDPLGSIVDLDLSGPAWLTGGEAALNGAAPTVAALALMATAAYALAPRPR